MRPTDKLIKQTFDTFGINQDTRALPSFKGRSILPLPGPIDGPIPIAMRTVDSPSGKKVVEDMKAKTGRGALSLPGVIPFYFVDIIDLPKVFFVLLSDKQRDQLSDIMEAQVQKLAQQKMKILSSPKT